MWSSAEGEFDIKNYNVVTYINDKAINHFKVVHTVARFTVNSSSIHAAGSVVSDCGPAAVTPALLHSGGAVICKGTPYIFQSV